MDLVPHPIIRHSPSLANVSLKSALETAGRFWPLLIPPVLILSLLNRFPYPSAAAPYSDLAITHYPNALFLIKSIREWGQLPLWSPAILGGYPFVANPLSGLWYPPGWLALLLPLPFGFNLSVALHLLWGGLGMYRFLRMQDLNYYAGLCGALAFEAMPKLFAHYGAGHLTLLYAVPWTPWLLWAWQRSVDRGKRRDRWTRGDFLPGILFSLIFLADVRWAAYAGILWLMWAIAHSQLRNPISTLLDLARQGLFAILLAAPLALPLIEYTRLSSRAGLEASEVLALSLPIERLLGLFVPGIHGFHEWMVYPGAVVLVLALYALMVRRPERCRLVWFWAGIASLGFFIALGSSFPFLDRLAGLPGINFLRVPARALFLSGMSLAILAAIGMDSLLAAPGPAEIRRARWGLVALNCFTLGMAMSVGRLAGKAPASFMIGALLILAASVWLWLGIPLSGIRTSLNWFAGLLLIASLDLGMVDRQVLTGREQHAVLVEGQAAAAYLAGKPGRFRVYSPSYSLPQQTAANYGLELLDGVDPLQLESLLRFMESASGVPGGGYSVTMPPFATGTPDVDNRGYQPDPAQLGLLNVAYVVSEFDLSVSGFTLLARFGESRVYGNAYSRPRAWVQTEGSSTLSRNLPVEAFTWTPNRITIKATGPGTLVLSEIAYPGWEGWVNGARQEIKLAEGVLRTVSLEPGEHQVVFRYRPISLVVGSVLAGVAISFLLIRSAFRWVFRSERSNGREG